MISDKTNSKIKLWVNLGWEIQTWYSFLKENKLPTEKVIERMKTRILDGKLKGHFALAIFYDNISGEVIEKTTGITFNKDELRIKLWIGFPDMKQNETWYNHPGENTLQNHEIIAAMQTRILETQHRMNFNIARFYNIQGFLLKTVTGNLVKKTDQ